MGWHLWKYSSSPRRFCKTKVFFVSSIHLRPLTVAAMIWTPFLSSFKKVIVPELNLGQLSTILKAKYVREIISYNKVQGKPFKVTELREEFVKYLSANYLNMSTTTEEGALTKKDFVTPNDVRWCPDAVIMPFSMQFNELLPELGIPREKFVVVSGIGCSSRFPLHEYIWFSYYSWTGSYGCNGSGR